MTRVADVVIVGGGIAGSAAGISLARAGLDVSVLEFQEEYRDLVRGEMLAPWGSAEAERIGALDAILAAAPAPLHEWRLWDEIHAPDDAPAFDLTRRFAPGGHPPFAIRHDQACQRLAQHAIAAGASLTMGVRDIKVEGGHAPSVTYSVGGRRISQSCRLVIGAGGRHGPVGKQVGLPLARTFHHWGAGLAIADLEGWPAGVQAIGTEGDTNFFVFPQQHRRARLYLNYPTAKRRAFAGPGGTDRFLKAFDLACLPSSLRHALLAATPAGPCVSAPALSSWTEQPFTSGVVLIGDEAGANCPVLGTGLSNGLRDARIVSEALAESRDWSPESFVPYALERRRRLGRLNFVVDALNMLFAEFGPANVERRKRAWERIHANPSFQMLFTAGIAGPERVPDAMFEQAFIRRLFAGSSTRRTLPALLETGEGSRVAS